MKLAAVDPAPGGDPAELDYAERFLREERAHVERVVARSRLIVIGVLLAIQVLLFGLSGGAPSDVALIGFELGGLAYGTAVLLYVRRFRYAGWISYLTTALDLGLVTAALLAAGLVSAAPAGSAEGIAVAPYFLIVVSAGLRLSWPLALFAAVTAALGYGALLAPALFLAPDTVTFTDIRDLPAASVSGLRVVILDVYLVFVGGIVGLIGALAARSVRRAVRTTTFLFADLRGYTAFVEARGDAAGADLVAAYRKIVRQEVRRRRGSELKTEGDGFLAEFPTAHQAVECGLGILAAARRYNDRADAPLAIGIGIHAGEPIPLDRDLIGSALNVAARLSSAAEAGQLLMSATARGLLRTSGFRGIRRIDGLEMKGLPSEPVYAMTLEEGPRARW